MNSQPDNKSGKRARSRAHVNTAITPVILCGGSGTRLWPLSRSDRPKQFLHLSGDGSLLQQTVLRACAAGSGQRLIVVANRTHRHLVAAELEALDVAGMQLVIEPAGRNTAPALAAAAEQALRHDPEALLLAMPADHYFENTQGFVNAVRRGIDPAQRGTIVVFGIKPTFPHVGYGYIRRGRRLQAGVFRVRQFHEKPDTKTATEYAASGEYFWNSGIFLVRADVYLAELARHAPDIAECACEAVSRGHTDGNRLYLDEQFAACRSDSIDYAVMEHVDNAALVPLNVAWSDLGSWLNVHATASTRDADGNVTHGQVFLLDTESSLVHSSNKLVAAIGLKNMLVVDTPDALLIAPLERSDDVKKVIEVLREKARLEVDCHSGHPDKNHRSHDISTSF